jgi:hypothetical protein
MTEPGVIGCKTKACSVTSVTGSVTLPVHVEIVLYNLLQMTPISPYNSKNDRIYLLWITIQ